MEITLSPKTKIDIHTSVTYQDLEQLFPICMHGIPENISEGMRESLQVFVCLSLNPYRSLWSKSGGR